MKRIYLPVAELLCCVSIYISALIYVFYQAYLVGNGSAGSKNSTFVLIPQKLCFIFPELSRIDPYAYFTDGWLIPHRHRDYDDTEWEGFLLFTTKYIFWYICHILITEIVRFTLPRVKKIEIEHRPHITALLYILTENPSYTRPHRCCFCDGEL